MSAISALRIIHSILTVDGGLHTVRAVYDGQVSCNRRSQRNYPCARFGDVRMCCFDLVFPFWNIGLLSNVEDQHFLTVGSVSLKIAPFWLLGDCNVQLNNRKRISWFHLQFYRVKTSLRKRDLIKPAW